MSKKGKAIGTELINEKGRIICVGDLHGVHKEAVILLNDIVKISNEDTVVFLGDTIDRGPQNDLCVDLAMNYTCILGNHEMKHLKYKYKEEAGIDPKVAVATHIETRKQLKPHHYEYFKTLPHYIRFPQYNAIAVHAGIFPGVPIEDQDPEHLLHIQMISPETHGPHLGRDASKWPSKCPPTWKFWTNYYKGSEKIIFGHSVLNKPLITENAVGIDLGAVFGGELCAYDVGSGEIFTIKADKDYGKGSRGRSNDDIKTYPVHGDVFSYS